MSWFTMIQEYSLAVRNYFFISTSLRFHHQHWLHPPVCKPADKPPIHRFIFSSFPGEQFWRSMNVHILSGWNRITCSSFWHLRAPALPNMDPMPTNMHIVMQRLQSKSEVMPSTWNLKVWFGMHIFWQISFLWLISPHTGFQRSVLFSSCWVKNIRKVWGGDLRSALNPSAEPTCLWSIQSPLDQWRDQSDWSTLVLLECHNMVSGKETKKIKVIIHQGYQSPSFFSRVWGLPPSCPASSSQVWLSW